LGFDKYSLVVEVLMLKECIAFFKPAIRLTYDALVV
jgi:hypothetical protein